MPPFAPQVVARTEDATYALWPRRNDPVPYTVQANDTVASLAARFGLQPTTITWANEEGGVDTDHLDLGQTLLIPPLDGVLHVVQAGDTLSSISERYGSVDPSLIAWFPGNNLDGLDAMLTVGQRIMVPGGTRPATVAAAPAAPALPAANPSRARSNGGRGYFGWPTGGWITTLYGSSHGGIDVGAAMYTPIFASETGEIVFSGWDDRGYGYAIVINHHNGWSTRYAHLSGMYYEVGTWVERGQLIALMGSTGRSTGPHLHFELMYQGYRYDPLDYLSR